MNILNPPQIFFYITLNTSKCKSVKYSKMKSQPEAF